MSSILDTIFLGSIAVVTVLVVWLTLIHKSYRWLDPWRGKQRNNDPVVHLNLPMAVRPNVLGATTPLGYRLSSLYFGTGLIDRTKTLDQGFPYSVLDTIPTLPASSDPAWDENPQTKIESLCLARADSILKRARAENRQINVLWSGGIDSTAAAAALLQQADRHRDQIVFYYTDESVAEYRKFIKHNLKDQQKVRVKRIENALDPEAIIVTGEHGDQIFGSMRALNIPWSKLKKPWQEAFPQHLREELASTYRADEVLAYLTPQIAACPIPLNSFWDLLWWLNFSQKWQAVSMRIPAQLHRDSTMWHIPKARTPEIFSMLDSTEHFFRTDQFQLWAMQHREAAIEPGNWRSYKLPLKEFIYQFNGDKRYLRQKQKIPSLQNVTRKKTFALSKAILSNRTACIQAMDLSLKLAIADFETTSKSTGPGSDNTMQFTYSEENEADLWSSLSDDGE